MIVFNGSRPFGANPYSRTGPTVPAQRVSLARSNTVLPTVKTLVLVVGDGGAALHKPKETLFQASRPGREQRQRIDLDRLQNGAKQNQTRIRSTQR